MTIDSRSNCLDFIFYYEMYSTTKASKLWILEYICCFIYIICVITIMIENYTMDPNSTSLFILTLRESYKLSDSRVILYLLLPSPWVPHFLTPAHG